MGTVTFAQAGGTTANAIDDVTPKVAEEAWDQGYSVLQSFGSKTNSGAIAYKSAPVEVEGFTMTFGLDYDPAAGAKGSDHDAVATKDTKYGSGNAMVVKLTSPLGITLGAGRELVNGQPDNPDLENLTAYALYSMGPVSLGYQGYYLDNGSTDGHTTGSSADYSGAAYSVAFNVNDDLSIGYQVVDETQEGKSATLSADREITSITAAYSTGGMTVSVQQTDTDNRGFAVAGSEINVENVQVTLSFAF